MSAATMQAASDPQQKATFISLPGELRNYIYKLSRCLDAHQCLHCDRVWREELEDHFISSAAGVQYTCSIHLYEVATMWSEANAALWVNRSSRFAEGEWKRCGRLSGMRTMQIDCSGYAGHKAIGCCEASSHGHKHTHSVAQPGLTKVSKQIREETLSMLYGTHTFLVTLMEKNIDGGLICKWLRTIVYRKKKDKHYIEKELMKAMEKLGVRTDDGVLKVKTLEYPFCYCEGCIRRVIQD
ncbi:hypothetical protein LTR37_009800 [Vermiconidia calcicola]|uniref:Uncharacterized protein n=1 Tax=Vermiconidia calcicola TaxID=1690605 RepID=A0ACC3N9M6_9PEZI|nr:hypothetical protein LTR37_009800 [Vermiconidia calcicola]